MTAETPEFSRPLRVSEISKSGKFERLEASPAELSALSRRFGILAMKSLKAEVSLRPWRKSGLRVQGTVSAILEQECVVTLDRFETALDIEVDLKFTAPDDITAAQTIEDGELVLEVTGDDPPEPLEGDSLDLGEAIAQAVSVEIDPYPRKPGVEFEKGEEEPEKTSPFAALAALKKDGNPEKSGA